MKRLAVILACTLLGGCATVTVSRDGATMVNIENSGWYLLGCLPIITGNPEKPGRIKLFRDTVTLENNIKMLADKARQENAGNVANLTSRVREDLAIGFFIFGRKQVFTSAVITK